MRFLPFILKSIYRGRRRTLLTGGGISVAVFVIASLLSVEAGFASLGASAEDSIIDVYEKGVACVVTSRVLDSYLAAIKQAPRVAEATGVLRGVYSYQSKDNPIMVAGIDYPSFQSIKHLTFAEGGPDEFAARADAALVGKRLAGTFHWKAGQTVSLLENGLTFTVSGIFLSKDKSYEGMVLLRKDYLSRLSQDEGRSTLFIVSLHDPTAVAPVAKYIDQEFSNYPKPTKSQSERDAKEAELRDYRELRRMLSLMLLATIAVSIVGAANSVSMSIRDRAREVGILRALGVPKATVFGVLTAEAVLVALGGGAIGLALSSALMISAGSLKGLIPLAVSAGTLSAGLGAAFLIGLLGAIVPGAGAVRARIVETLRTAD